MIQLAPSRFSLVDVLLSSAYSALSLPVFLEIVEPVAVSSLRPYVMRDRKASHLCFAESVDPHEFTACIPVLTECLTQPLLFLSYRLVNRLLGKAACSESMDLRDAITHAERIEPTVTIVILSADLGHSIMCVMCNTCWCTV